MHAFLLINTDPFEFAKKQKAKVIPFTLQKIDDARDLKKFVKFKFNQKTAIVIENIDNATIEASNAFLKNLEEPGNNLIYILTASNLNNVLPTIISRCEIVSVQGIENRVQLKQLNHKDGLNIKDRDEAVKFVEGLLGVDHQNQEFKNMENYLVTLKALKANGNVSLQMASLIARMNSHG